MEYRITLPATVTIDQGAGQVEVAVDLLQVAPRLSEDYRHDYPIVETIEAEGLVRQIQAGSLEYHEMHVTMKEA